MMLGFHTSTQPVETALHNKQDVSMHPNKSRVKIILVTENTTISA